MMKKLIKAWKSHIKTENHYVFDPKTETYEEEHITTFTGFPAYVLVLLVFSIAGLLSFGIASLIMV